jgi:hypothetical protein
LGATELADRPADPGSGGAAGVAAIIARDRPDAQQKAMGDALRPAVPHDPVEFSVAAAVICLTEG